MAAQDFQPRRFRWRVRLAGYSMFDGLFFIEGMGQRSEALEQWEWSEERRARSMARGVMGPGFCHWNFWLLNLFRASNFEFK